MARWDLRWQGWLVVERLGQSYAEVFERWTIEEVDEAVTYLRDRDALQEAAARDARTDK